MPTLHSIATIHERLGHVPSRHHVKAPSPLQLPTTPNGSLDDSQTPFGQQGGGSPLVKTVSKRSMFGALFSRTLPTYSGPYDVGIFDIEVPVELPRQIGSFVLRDLPEHGGGFKLETVLFSVFYPCEPPKVEPPKPVWFPRLSQTVNGFLKMAKRTSWLYKTLAYPIAAAAIYGTTFPANPEAPLRRPDDGQHWPVVVFSHGVGCSRLMYSSFCGELASRGYVVCAVEHRDGTGPSSSVKLHDGTVKDVDFINYTDVEWPHLPADEQPSDDTTLRHDQLRMRCAEIQEVLTVMRRISQGAPLEETSLRSPHFDWSRWGPDWSALQVDGPIMTGHSLGGSAGLLAASLHDTFDFRCVVAFDPAVQRLEPWSGTIACPLLCVNSEEFTLSADMERLQQLARTARNPPIYSISGSTHPSFSDVFLIVPGFINRRTGLKLGADEMLERTMDLTVAFLEGGGGAGDDGLAVNEWEGPLETPLGEPGSVNWHPAHEQLEPPSQGGEQRARPAAGDASPGRAAGSEAPSVPPRPAEDEETQKRQEYIAKVTPA